MGQEFRYWCPVETWKLVWLTGTMFAVIITFQYFELPHWNILSSTSSVHKALVAGNSSLITDGVSSMPEMVSNTTQSNGISGENSTFMLEKSGTPDTGVVSIVPVVPPVNSSTNLTFPRNMESNTTTPVVPLDPNTTRVDKDATPNNTFSRNVQSNTTISVVPVDLNTSRMDKGATPSLDNNGKSGELQNNHTILHNNSPVTTVPKVKKKRKLPTSRATTVSAVKKMPEMPSSAVISISEMNNLLLQSWSSPYLVRPRWSSAVDRELLHAKSQIENAPMVENDPILYAPLYRNVSMFKMSYQLMEAMLKVYVYKEGEKPILHQPVLQGIYASEGWFMKLLEANKQFVTKKPRKAHLFYLPFGSRNLEEALYVANSHSHKNLIQFLKNYVDMIAGKYPFWNRTEGADHFLVACHDWAPAETRQYMANCIRALCNADVKEGFVFGKDVSLPETYVRIPRNPVRDLGGKRTSKRSILAFFAGNMHGYVRPILLHHWENKDPDMKIFGPLPKTRGKMNYIQYMKSSKYCICAKGYEVNSPRVVEAIFYECVPVIISDNFVPPFFEVLNWESFAVFVLEKDIPNLKSILLSIPRRRYLQMQMRVKKVQQHFLWHPTPVKYDLFHMILHSVWYNRVFQTSPTN